METMEQRGGSGNPVMEFLASPGDTEAGSQKLWSRGGGAEEPGYGVSSFDRDTESWSRKLWSRGGGRQGGVMEFLPTWALDQERLRNSIAPPASVMLSSASPYGVWGGVAAYTILQTFPKPGNYGVADSRFLTPSPPMESCSIT